MSLKWEGFMAAGQTSIIFQQARFIGKSKGTENLEQNDSNP